MKVIITRPDPDGPVLANRLAGLGYDVLQAPLMTIRFADDAPLPAQTLQALLVTSANALRALDHMGAARALLHLPVLAVGPASAQLARDMGFASVREAGGNVDGLARLALETLSPEGAPLLYITGTSRAGDLKGDLEAQGFAVHRSELYSAVRLDALPAGVTGLLISGEPCAVLLYSPRSAQTWLDLVNASPAAGNLSGVKHLCLSDAVAKVVVSSVSQQSRIEVADAPNDDAMMTLLQQTCPVP